MGSVLEPAETILPNDLYGRFEQETVHLAGDSDTKKRKTTDVSPAQTKESCGCFPVSGALLIFHLSSVPETGTRN